jgi:hypothetical protein
MTTKTRKHDTNGHAVHEFQRTVSGVIPEVVDPLRTRIVDAAIELADDLVAAQFKFHRSIVQIADRALSTSDDEPGATDSHGHD